MKISEDYLRCVGVKRGKFYFFAVRARLELEGVVGVMRWLNGSICPCSPSPPCHMLPCPLPSQDVSIGSFVQPQLSRHMKPLCLLAVNRKHLLNTLVLHPPCPIVHTALNFDSFPLIPTLLSAVEMFKSMRDCDIRSM